MIIKDQYGEVIVPEGAKWGKNTQRSLENFPIGTERMPEPLIRMLLELKRACAIANENHGQLNPTTSNEIVQAIDTILNDDYEALFPLSVWQTGSGTQTNMNANEVIAFVASHEIHPNDDVNRGQSSNDIFPSVLHMMTVSMVARELLPALIACADVLEELESNYGEILKTGRTHLQDATPLTFGQEISGWNAMLQFGIEIITEALVPLRYLAIGGTAVGTGLNTVEGFDVTVCKVLNEQLGLEFEPSKNKFHALSSKDALLHMHSALSTTATNLMKMANDIRWLASGPRTGLGELTLPANEPGSSIMPGKVNPTQIEALTMVCVRIMGNQQSMLIANSQGNFELNVYMPLMGYTMWQSITLLRDAVASFTKRCLVGLKPNQNVMADNLNKTLMTATHLNQHLGYDVVTRLVNEAHACDLDIKTVVLKHQIMTEEEFDRKFNIAAMVKPNS